MPWAGVKLMCGGHCIKIKSEIIVVRAEQPACYIQTRYTTAYKLLSPP